MDVETFTKQIKLNTSLDETISSCTLFLSTNEEYSINFDNYVEAIRNIKTFKGVCRLFNVPSQDVSLIKIFNSRNVQENFIFFNPSYLDSVMTEYYEPDDNTIIQVSVENETEITLKIEDFILNYKNLFNSYASSKAKKHCEKRVKKISSDRFFETTETTFQMNITLDNERIYAGGRLSLPNSISFKFFDSTIIYQSKIVFSKDGLLKPDCFQKYIDHYKRVFFTNPKLIYIDLSEPKFTFTIAIEKQLNTYVSVHSKNMFRIKKDNDVFVVVFKNVGSFEEHRKCKSILESEIEHYLAWRKANKKNIFSVTSKILKEIFEQYF